MRQMIRLHFTMHILMRVMKVTALNKYPILLTVIQYTSPSQSRKLKTVD